MRSASAAAQWLPTVQSGGWGIHQAGALHSSVLSLSLSYGLRSTVDSHCASHQTLSASTDPCVKCESRQKHYLLLV